MPLVKDKKGNWSWEYDSQGLGPVGQPPTFDFAQAALQPSTTGLPGETIKDEYERLAQAAKLTKGFDPAGQSLADLQKLVAGTEGLIAGTKGAYIHDPDAHKPPGGPPPQGGSPPPPQGGSPPPPVTSGPSPEEVTGAPMFDIAAGYELDKIALARDIALSDAQNQIAQMGARILELESNMRGPQNAIQYSNLRYGLQDFAGGYPAFLNRLGGLAYSGTQRPDPFKGIVDMNALPAEAVGYPGIIRAFDPNSIDIRTLRNLPEYDMQLYQNFVESAGGNFQDLIGSVGRFMPGETSIGGAFAGYGG